MTFPPATRLGINVWRFAPSASAQKRRGRSMSGGGCRLSRRRDGPDSGRRSARQTAQSAEPQQRNWIWFRSEANGRRLALEEFVALSTEGQAGLTKAMQRYRDGQARRQDVDSIGDGIFELRYRHGTEQFRVLFMHWGPHLVALTAFQKKQPKTPKPDLDRARARARRWWKVFGTDPSGEPS